MGEDRIEPYSSEVGTMADISRDLSPALNLHVVKDEIQRIVLTGFMGAGKSTVGLLLAGHTGGISSILTLARKRPHK
jgi:Fe-S cluster assembly ATPase SufC